MVHAIVGLLDNSAHIDIVMWHTQPQQLAWPDAYIASNKHPAPDKGLANMRLDSLCTYTMEDPEFLDTPIHIHVHVTTMQKYKTI